MIGAALSTALLMQTDPQAVCAADAARDAAAKQDMKKLQGTWKTVASEVDGQKIEASSTTAAVTIKGDKYTVTYPPSETRAKKVSEMTFKINPSKKPKAIDFTAADGSDKGKLSKGIYELDSDILKICFNPDKEGERPTTFATKAGARVRCIILKREKP
jgi:uncharacterized protein (TIGR03067 family)